MASSTTTTTVSPKLPMPLKNQYEAYGLVINMVLKGEKKEKIKQEVSTTYNIQDETLLENVYQNGKEYFKKRMFEKVDLEDLIHVHVSEYEEIYKFFDGLDYLPGKKQALLSKERLLGYHKNENVFEVNQENTTVIETEPLYDINKLETEEQTKLLSFLERVKVKKQK